MQHRPKISLAEHHPECMATIFKLKTDDLQANYKLRETWLLHECFIEHWIEFHWNKIQTLSYYQTDF